MKRALIVTALAGFIRSFLMSDIALLHDLGFEVHCAANACHPGSDGVEKVLREAGAVFHQVDFSSSKPLSLATYRAWRELSKLSETMDFDLVHCHTPIAGAVTRDVFKGARKRRAVVLYTVHGFYFHGRSSRLSWFLYGNIEKYFSRFTDMMITINREDYRNARHMHCKDVRYIPGVGVDIDKFHEATIDRSEYRSRLGLSDDDFVILAVGELSRRKNHRIVIEALAESRIENAVLVICGNAIANLEVKKELAELARSLCVDVRFLGLRDDVAQICKCADIGVLPSLREGLGLAGIEMLASGLPLVASNVQGIPDYVVDGVNGYLCDPDDSVGFKRAIELLTDDDLRAHMSAACYRSVRAFRKTESVSTMAEIYHDAVFRMEGGLR